MDIREIQELFSCQLERSFLMNLRGCHQMSMISRVGIEIIEDIPVFCRSGGLVYRLFVMTEWTVFLSEHAFYGSFLVVDIFIRTELWCHRKIKNLEVFHASTSRKRAPARSDIPEARAFSSGIFPGVSRRENVYEGVRHFVFPWFHV